MGSGHTSGGAGGGGGGGGNSNNGGGGNGGCCDMSLRCWCRWRWENIHYYKNRFFSSGFLFFFACLLLFGSFATFYAWLAFPPSVGTHLQSFGCQEDNEGSWSIGVFYGDSPFNLKPIETVSSFINSH